MKRGAKYSHATTPGSQGIEEPRYSSGLQNHGPRRRHDKSGHPWPLAGRRTSLLVPPRLGERCHRGLAVAAYPCVAEGWSSWCGRMSVHSHGAPTGAAAAFMIRPIATPSASTSKSSSFHSPPGRERGAFENQRGHWRSSSRWKPAGSRGGLSALEARRDPEDAAIAALWQR